MKPKLRMYIDARHEKFQYGDIKYITYIINGANEEHIKQKIYDSIGRHCLRLEIISETEKVIVTYYENIISPTYMEYRFNLKGLNYKKQDF